MRKCVNDQYGTFKAVVKKTQKKCETSSGETHQYWNFSGAQAYF